MEIIQNMKNIEFLTYKGLKGYVVYLSYFDSYLEQQEKEILSDEMCDILEIRYYEYVNIVLKEFNGFLISNKTICYNTKEDYQKAIDWLESRILMKKLEEQ